MLIVLSRIVQYMDKRIAHDIAKDNTVNRSKIAPDIAKDSTVGWKLLMVSL